MKKHEAEKKKACMWQAYSGGLYMFINCIQLLATIAVLLVALNSNKKLRKFFEEERRRQVMFDDCGMPSSIAD